MDDKQPPKVAWSGSHGLFIYFAFRIICLEHVKYVHLNEKNHLTILTAITML